MAKAAATTKKEPLGEPKFHVGHIADDLGVEETTARIRLRNAGIAKTHGRQYGWPTEKAYKDVLSQLKTATSTPKKAAAEKAPAKGKAASTGRAARKAAKQAEAA
jgi:hypothetical protein